MFRKINHIIVILIFTLFVFSIYSNAQVNDKHSKKTPEEIAREISDRLRDELQLSGTQYNQVYGIFVNHITQVQSDRQKYGKEDSEQRNNAIIERRKKLKSELENVLSDEQMENLKELHKKRHQRNRTGPKDRI